MQNVYKTKAQHDVEAVMTRIERLLLNINKPYDYINENQVKLFCKLLFFRPSLIHFMIICDWLKIKLGKNAHFLKSIRYRSLAEEYDPQTSKIDELMGNLVLFFCYFIVYLVAQSSQTVRFWILL